MSQVEPPPKSSGGIGNFRSLTQGLRRVGPSVQASRATSPNSGDESTPPSVLQSDPKTSFKSDGPVFATSSNANFDSNYDYGDSASTAAEDTAINNSIDTLPPTVLIFMVAALTSFCGFMSGYDTGYISSALVIMKTEDIHAVLTSKNKELITSATSLGALITALFGGALADAFGRKWVITLANPMFILGAALQTGAHSLWMMIIGRFIMGFGIGVTSLVAPMYLSEMAPTKYRGRLVVMYVLFLTFGQLVAYAIGYGLTNVKNGWRIEVGLSLIPCVTQMCLFVFMPESPRYLVSRGRHDETRQVLRKIYSNPSEEQISAKVSEISSDVPIRAFTSTDNVPYQKKIRSAIISYEHNLRELFVRPENFRGLAIIVIMQALQQFSGWNSLLYYSGTMFKSVGFENPTAVSIIIAGTNFVFTGVAFLIIDRVGRRAILVGTMWGMVVGLVMCAIAFHFVVYDPNGGIETDQMSNTWSVIIIVFIFFFAMSYATGIGNIPWQQAEMLPMQVRGVGTSFSTAMNWGGSLVISATFLTMLDNITPTGTFAFYASVCFIGWLLCIFFYPETASLSLEEIQGCLKGGFQVRESVALSKRKIRLLKGQS